MKLKTPFKYYIERKQRQRLEFQIRDLTRILESEPLENLRRELIELHMDYRHKYKREYKW